MPDILVNLGEQLFHEPSSLPLDEVLAQLNEWPDDATCATQESDGEVLYWSAPVEEVVAGRQRAGTGDMMREIGLAAQIHAAYLNLNDPVVAADWSTAVSVHPRLRKSVYQTEKRMGCLIITGTISLREMTELIDQQEGGHLMDQELARRLKATLVVGSQYSLDQLRASLPAVDGSLLVGLPEGAREWLESGERGISSETMFEVFTGVPLEQDRYHPQDLDDFRRCRLLLEQVPAFVEKLPLMAEQSPQWAGLVNRWDAICTAMDAETPHWRISGIGGPAGEACRLIQEGISEMGELG